ncbi:MAG: hypothetical protein WD894_13290 [Pirellulales bacterium]
MSTHISSSASSETVRVRLENGPRWLELQLSLDGDWNGGRLIVYPHAGIPDVRAADDLSRTYDLQTWETGMMSGAFQAYRALNCPRRRVVVADLRGLLSSADMTALAAATAIGVAKLLGNDLPNLDIPQWRVVDLSLSNGQTTFRAGHNPNEGVSQ